MRLGIWFVILLVIYLLVKMLAIINQTFIIYTYYVIAVILIAKYIKNIKNDIKQKKILKLIYSILMSCMIILTICVGAKELVQKYERKQNLKNCEKGIEYCKSYTLDDYEDYERVIKVYAIFSGFFVIMFSSFELASFIANRDSRNE